MIEVRDEFDPNLRKKINKKSQIAIIPVGSIEQHGPHLPISTDSDIVTAVTSKLAEKNNYLLLPTINYGVSFEHAPFFNLSIKNTTMRALLTDLSISLADNNIKTIFIINGHHGNLSALKNIQQKICKESKRKIKVFVFSYWHFTKREFDHAGFVETSLMLGISKNTKMKLAKKGLDTTNMSKKEITKIGKLANKSFPEATKNGIWGDPRKASKKEGLIIFNEIITNLAKKCQTCLTESRS